MAAKFLQRAVPKRRRGIFTKKAKAAGMGVQEYAQKVGQSKSASTQLKRQAAFARTAGRPGGFAGKSRRVR